MSQFLRILSCAALALSLMPQWLSAQISLSPYSRYGIGEIFNPSSTRNFAMGNLGIGTFDGTTINRINPASYADLRLTTLDFSGFGVYTQQKSNVGEQSLGTAGFHNVSLGFANKKGFGIVAGLAPYSSTGYNVVLQDSIFADTAYKAYSTTYSANGGLNQLYFGAGVRFFRHLNLGVNLSFAFGATNFLTTTNFADTRLLPVNIDKRVTLNGIIPQFGVQYGDTLLIRKEMERTKLIEDDIKLIDQELKTLERDSLDMVQGEPKRSRREAEQLAELKAMEEERARMNKEVEALMKDEVANEKALRKLQEKQFRLEKKRKKKQREMKTELREQEELERRIAGRRQKLEERRTSLLQEIEDIKAGRKEATETHKQAYLIRVGGIFEPASSLNGERLMTYDNSLVTDSVSSTEGSVRLPMKYGLGFSLSRPGRWSLGLDASLQDWSTFTYFNESNSLQQALAINAGGEWIPDMTSDSYAARVAYRAGAYYNASFLNLNGNPINEVGITLGAGIPLGYFSPYALNYSRVNLGVGIGRKGTLEGNLLEETTFHFRVGVNLNDIWFIKSRIN